MMNLRLIFILWLDERLAGSSAFVWKVGYPIYVVLTMLRIRIHMFLGLPDPDPLVRDPNPALDPSIPKQK